MVSFWQTGSVRAMTSSGGICAPTPGANGRAVREVFQRWHGNGTIDDAFAEHVASIRDIALAELDADPWRD